MKRFFDFTMSLLLIILLSPLFLIISVIILFDAGSPVIFKQYRVGKDNKLFYVYKFRTMHCNTRNVATDELTESVNCITKSGRFLRKTSLDELPQLFNILSGSMSFVGPRPLIPEEKEIRALRREYAAYASTSSQSGTAGLCSSFLLSTAGQQQPLSLELIFHTSALRGVPVQGSLTAFKVGTPVVLQ